MSGHTDLTIEHLGCSMKEALTLEKLEEALKLLGPAPPKQTFCSSRIFPKFVSKFVGDDGEEFFFAHPDVWSSVPERRIETEILGLNGVQIHNLDTNPSERSRFANQMMKSSMRRNGG